MLLAQLAHFIIFSRYLAHSHLALALDTSSESYEIDFDSYEDAGFLNLPADDITAPGELRLAEVPSPSY